MKLKLFLDEDIHTALSHALRQRGFDVVHAQDLKRKGKPDIERLWVDEAIRRDDEIDKGASQAYPAEEVLARARARRK